ncbi:hypothetical protein Q3G72_034276 [Acer saccharum]|nr:hypothetical protein Q3G72_034276 [Acer saccharum]
MLLSESCIYLCNLQVCNYVKGLLVPWMVGNDFKIIIHDIWVPCTDAGAMDSQIIHRSLTKPHLMTLLNADDVVALLDSLSISKAFLVGKDAGVIPAYMVAAAHPEKVAGIITMGVPFMIPGPMSLQIMDKLPKGFYILRWQTVIRKIYILFSGSELQVAGDDQETMGLADPSTPLPPRFSEEDLSVYTGLYENSGFRTALQVPYRGGEKMGLVGVPENGNGETGVSLALGSKNKYRRMDSELTEDDDHYLREERKSTTRKYVLACAVFASLNNVLLGYDVGVMSGAVIFIQEDLKITDVQVEVLIGILSIISLVGSLAGGKTSDVLGRKWTMALAAVVFQIGAVVMTVAPSFEILMIGRVLTGVGIGLGVMIAPVYIAEISPNIARGSLTSFPEIFINVGILLGYVSNYAFSGLSVHISWRVMLAVGILPSVIVGFALFIIPESPRWLVMQNRVEEARLVLLKTNEDEKEGEERLEEILVAAGMSNGEKYEEKAVWRELLSPSPSLQRMLVTGFGIQCFQQITGIDATVYYSPEIFKQAGIENNSKLLAATVAVGITKTVFILFAIFLIDKLGRKPLLYVSTIGMTVCLFSLALGQTLLGKGELGIALTILSVCGNVAFFSVGLGPVCWVLTSEIFPLRLRAQAAALGAVGNRVCSGLVAMTFLSVSHKITVGGTFFIFSFISAFAVLFVYKLVPETKGKSLEQIELLFKNELDWQESEIELGDAEQLVDKQ